MRIRRTAALAALLLAVSALPGLAEEKTLEEVLEAHYEAIGGLEAWDAWKTMQLTGTMNMGEMQAPYTMTFANGLPARSRLEFTVQGMTGVMAYDGEVAWAISPFQGKTDPELMDEDQTRNWKEQSDLAGPLIKPDEKGVQLELLGKEDVEGTSAYKIRATLENGDVRHYYLDADYYLPIRTEASTVIQGQEIDVETSYGDYKNVGDLVLAHVFSSKPKNAPAGQTITILNAELDVELPDDYFSMPEAAAPAAAGDGS
ncbi:MAG: hypothetical protein R3325_02510 [Thermoanaerobaculia bacterium]|nr:hypothetical protein [Thermoanaerobaculia bacterium]